MAIAYLNHPRLLRVGLWIAACAAFLPLLTPLVSLRINLTHSHPAHVFLVLKHRTPHRGDLAVVTWPTDAYWPAGSVMLKPILAEGPSTLSWDHRTAIVNGQPWATAVEKGRHGQPLPIPAWDGLVPEGWVLLGTTQVWDSWDSRYYGPVPTEWLDGIAVPIF